MTDRLIIAFATLTVIVLGATLGYLLFVAPDELIEQPDVPIEVFQQRMPETFPAAVELEPVTESAPKVASVTVERPVAKPVLAGPAPSAPSTSTTAAPTTTTTAPVLSPSQRVVALAMGELGKSGSYSEGGFWCAKFVSYVAEQAGIDGWQSSDSPARLKFDAASEGRILDAPAPGSLIFFDIADGAAGPDYVSHVGIVERVEGDTIHTLEGNRHPNVGIVAGYSYKIDNPNLRGFATFG